MKTWLSIFFASSAIAIVTLAFPVGGLNGLATLIANGSLLAFCITGLNQK